MGYQIGVAAAFAVILSLSPQSAHAWGPDGHKIVCQIAWDQLSEQVQAQIEAVRQDDDKEKYPTFADSCVWADDIRSDQAFDWAKPLHFLDVPEGGNDDAPANSCPTDGCVTSAIERFSNVLKDSSATAEDKLEALKFVGHFVGDLQQPLHVGHTEDKGGNDIHVKFFDHRTNLHSLWDSGMLKREFDAHDRDWQDLATVLEGQISDTEKGDWQAGTPADWAVDTHHLALADAYAGVTDGTSLGQTYYRHNIQIVYTQLQKGGVRLAAQLNSIFVH